MLKLAVPIVFCVQCTGTYSAHLNSTHTTAEGHTGTDIFSLTLESASSSTRSVSFGSKTTTELPHTATT